MQPGVWLPIAIYAQEEQLPGAWKAGGFRAQTHFWGYSLKAPNHQTQSTSVVVDDVINDSQSAQDVSPLQAQRDWYAQAAQNVLDRLVEAGLVAPPSAFDKTLDQVATNLIIGSKLALPGQIHCRVLLTTPLESLAVGNTILISKGLVDVLPNEEDLAAILSFQLAQIALGHRIDTRYAFDDQLLFPDEAAFQRIQLDHSSKDDQAAARRGDTNPAKLDLPEQTRQCWAIPGPVAGKRQRSPCADDSAGRRFSVQAGWHNLAVCALYELSASAAE